MLKVWKKEVINDETGEDGKGQPGSGLHALMGTSKRRRAEL